MYILATLHQYEWEWHTSYPTLPEPKGKATPPPHPGRYKRSRLATLSNPPPSRFSGIKASQPCAKGEER